MSLLGDLKTPVAVVDWVALLVELRRTSNAWHIKDAHKKFGVSYALPIDKGPGGAATKFEIRIQHPSSYAAIEGVLSNLEEKYGLASVPTLRGVEVSIDFYPLSADTSALQAMTERLMMSLAPALVDNPRIIGPRWDVTGGVLPSRCAIDAQKTLYIGNKGDDIMWRVYWKRTDDVFVGEDGKRTPKALPPAEFRARAEVRLQGKALEQLALVTVADLRGFSFERLHSAGLFKFANRDPASGPIFTNPYSVSAAKAIGIDDDSPACVLNGFGRRDSRKRSRQLSRHLSTDMELTEASRLALRRLSQRFTKPHRPG